MSSPRLPAIVFATLSLLLGCSVDQRKLELGPLSSDGGAPLGSGASATGGNPEPSDTGGSDSGGAPLVDGCADLDTDGVSDCAVTLLANSTFKVDVSGWAAKPEAALEWARSNALADSPPGSASLTTSATRGSAIQCVPLVGQQLVIAYANTFIEQASPAGTQTLLEVSFFDEPGCFGERYRSFETPPANAAADWLTVHAGALTEPTTQSVELALVAVREPTTTGTVRCYFDNVLLKTVPFTP